MKADLTRFARPAEVAENLGISLPTLWRWAKGEGSPDFPRPIKLSEKVTVWKIEEIEEWVKARRSGNNQK